MFCHHALGPRSVVDRALSFLPLEARCPRHMRAAASAPSSARLSANGHGLALPVAQGTRAMSPDGPGRRHTRPLLGSDAGSGPWHALAARWLPPCYTGPARGIWLPQPIVAGGVPGSSAGGARALRLEQRGRRLRPPRGGPRCAHAVADAVRPWPHAADARPDGPRGRRSHGERGAGKYGRRLWQREGVSGARIARSSRGAGGERKEAASVA